MSLQAAIVRVMKARQTLDHRSLVNEVFQLLGKIYSIESLKPLIKPSIESLIVQAYLRRDPDDRKKYIYVS